MNRKKNRLIKLFSSFIIFFICGCVNKPKTKKILSSSDLEVNIHDVFFKDKNTNVVLDIENLYSSYYYIMYSFEGDLDNREFPFVKIENKNLSVYFKVFTSEQVDANRLKNEGREPPIRSGDQISLQKIKPKEKRKLTFKFPYNYSDFNTVFLSLDVGKYKNNKLGNSKTIYMSPCSDCLARFSFEKITMMIYPDFITKETVSN